ncbi:MAG TPA: hypothetical protein VIT90_06605 [Lysobacter sp.]
MAIDLGFGLAFLRAQLCLCGGTMYVLCITQMQGVARTVMTGSTAIQSLIGFHTLRRPYESLYASVSRLIRANLLNQLEVKRLLPATWIESAFHFSATGAREAASSFSALAGARAPLSYRTQVAPWTFDALEHGPAGLRACRACLEEGFHSFAMQGELLGQCPKHGGSMTEHCWHCGAFLRFSGPDCVQHAFRCPQGCSLVIGNLGCLSDCYDRHMERELARVAWWMRAFRRTIEVESGLGHAIYPPMSDRVALYESTTPSVGLTAALCRTLLVSGRTALEPHPYLDVTDQSWRLSVDEFEPDATPEPPEEQAAFDRQAYWTTIPVPFPRRLARWIERNQWEERFPNEAPRLLEADQKGAILPSCIVTNGEINALRSILTWTDRRIVSSHYQVALERYLKAAYERRQSLAATPADPRDVQLSIAERVDFLVRIDARLYRVVGHRVSTDQNMIRRWTWARDPIGNQEQHVGVGWRAPPFEG